MNPFYPHRPRADHLPVRQCRPAVCAAAVSAAADRFRCAVRRHHRSCHVACSGRNADRRRTGRPLPQDPPDGAAGSGDHRYFGGSRCWVAASAAAPAGPDRAGQSVRHSGALPARGTRLPAPAAERHPAAARQRGHPAGGYRGRTSRSPCWVLFCWSTSASGVCWCSAAVALHFPPEWSCACAFHRMSHQDARLSVHSLWADLQESAQFLTGQAAVLRLAAAMAAVNLLEVPALTVGVPVLVVQTLQKSDASLGLVQAALSAGGILGGVLAGTVFVRRPIRSGTPLLLALSGVCAALGSCPPGVQCCSSAAFWCWGLCLWPWRRCSMCGSLRSCKCWCRRHSWARRQPACSVLACLTQPIGQAAYGSAFQHWAAHPADVLLAAGVLSALVLWLLQTRRTA